MEKQLFQIDCKERVAFDLFNQILRSDKSYTNKKDLLNLYQECLLAVQYPEKPKETD